MKGVLQGILLIVSILVLIYGWTMLAVWTVDTLINVFGETAVVLAIFSGLLYIVIASDMKQEKKC